MQPLNPEYKTTQLLMKPEPLNVGSLIQQNTIREDWQQRVFWSHTTRGEVLGTRQGEDLEIHLGFWGSKALGFHIIISYPDLRVKG
jgi:hypothetical protein